MVPLVTAGVASFLMMRYYSAQSNTSFKANTGVTLPLTQPITSHRNSYKLIYAELTVDS